MVAHFQGYVYKVVVRGLSGNDGNLYRFFLSSSPNLHVPIPGGNAFTYEYCCRVPAAPPSGWPVTVHLYPFANEHVVSIKQSNFDRDNSARLTIFSVAKNGHDAPVSGDGQWTSRVLPIDSREYGLSLDFRLVSEATTFNDVIFYVTDQYDTAVPFFAVPLGGPPRYKYDIDMKAHKGVMRVVAVMLFKQLRRHYSNYSHYSLSRPALRRGAVSSASWGLSPSAGRKSSRLS